MKRILILKLDPLRNIIYSLPLINNLKATFPNVSISWLVNSDCQNILEEHPSLNELIIYKTGKNILSRLHEYIDCLNSLKKEEFDLLIDLQGGLKGYLFTYFIKAKEKIALKNMPTIFPYSKHIPITSKNWWDQLTQLTNYLNLPPNEQSFNIDISPTDKEHIHYLFMQNGIKRETPKAILCPITAHDGKKGWDIDAFNKIISSCKQKSIVPIVIGNAADKRNLNAINDALVLTDISLKQKCFLIQRATSIISNDNEWVDITLSLGKKVIFVGNKNSIKERDIFKEKCLHLVSLEECIQTINT